MKKIVLKIVSFGVLFFWTALLASPSAQAKGFGVTAHYKYLLGLHRPDDPLAAATDSMGHGVQIDFMWSLDRNEATKVPSHALGFSVAGGGLTESIVAGGGSAGRVSDKRGGFYRLSVLYEYVFENGLGLSAGIGGGHIIGEREYGALGLTDLGLKYHLKNGLVFSFSTDFMVDPVSFSNAQALYYYASRPEGGEGEVPILLESDYYAFVLGVAVGIGYHF